MRRIVTNGGEFRPILLPILTEKLALFEQVSEVGKDGDSKPGLILIEYRDGFKFAMLLIPDVIVPDTDRDGQSGFDGAGGHCAYAARTASGEEHGCEFFLQPDAT